MKSIPVTVSEKLSDFTTTDATILVSIPAKKQNAESQNADHILARK